MNQKTGKLLSRYASQAGTSSKELRRWWESLPRPLRAAERKRILNELGVKKTK